MYEFFEINIRTEPVSE